MYYIGPANITNLHILKSTKMPVISQLYTLPTRLSDSSSLIDNSFTDNLCVEM